MATIDVEAILDVRVSFQLDVWSSINDELTLGDVLAYIRTGRYKMVIDELREYLRAGKDDLYDMFKKRLPGVTFSGTFEGARKSDRLKEYNPIIVVDVDNLDEVELKRARARLVEDEYVFALWDSPSQQGLKGLIKLSYSDFPSLNTIFEAHRIAFEEVAKHFVTEHGISIDKSGSDVARLCFLSYDCDLVKKVKCNEFFVEPRRDGGSDPLVSQKAVVGQTNRQPSLSRNVLYNPRGKNNQNHRKTIQSITRYLKKRNKSITGNYQNWYRVAYAIANSFAYDLGQKYFLALCRLDGEGHDEEKSNRLLLYCYEKSQDKITFATILYLARDQGYGKGGTEDD